MKLLALIAITASSLSASIVEQTMVQIKALNPQASVRALDYTHYSMDGKTLNSICKEFRRLLSRAGGKDSVDGFDCDDYANVFKAVVSLQGLKDGKNYACGVLGVVHKKPFGDIPTAGNSLHMLNLIILDGKPTVFEPQTLRGVTLAKYPNRTSIIEVTF